MIMAHNTHTKAVRHRGRDKWQPTSADYFFQKVLMEIMAEQELTQEDLGKKLGGTLQMGHDIVRLNTQPTLQRTIEIARLLGVPASRFIEVNEWNPRLEVLGDGVSQRAAIEWQKLNDEQKQMVLQIMLAFTNTKNTPAKE